MADNHPTTPLNSQELRRGLESLPQELWSEIYKIVFTAPHDALCISESLSNKPIIPSSLRSGMNLLHVSTASRALYAKTFYGRDAVLSAQYVTSTTALLRDWLVMLPKAHRTLLGKIVLAPESNKESVVEGEIPCPTFTCPIIRAQLAMIPRENHDELAAKLFLRLEGNFYATEFLAGTLCVRAKMSQGEIGWVAVGLLRLWADVGSLKPWPVC